MSVSRWRGTLIVSAISPRRRSSPRPIVSVGGIRIFISATRWGAVRIIAVAATCRWWVGIVNGWASCARGRWRTVAAVTGVIVVTRWGATTVIITTGAIATGRRWATAVVTVRWWIAAASTKWWGRARAVAIVAGNFVLGISQAANASSFEILIVQFVDGDFQVSGGLEFHESFAIAVAPNLGVDDVKSRTTCKVFEILRSK